MTSLSNYIKFTLNIEADNLEFLDASLEKHRGRDAKVYHAVLHLDHCLLFVVLIIFGTMAILIPMSAILL